MTLPLLAIIGILEAVVYQNRYRATHGSAMAAGIWTLFVCLLRIGFVVLGVSAVMREQWMLALVVYAVPAALVTLAVRARELRNTAPILDPEFLQEPSC